MGYLQALRLMVKAYKAAKGTMPKGIDLLKIKMRARQKAIDSTKGKVIQFPPERITNPFKARPQPPKIEMKGGIQTTRGLGDLFKRQMEKIGQKAKQESKPKSKKLEDAMESFFGFKPRRETEAQMLARMKRENKEAAQRLRDKKKPRDDKAGGGITSAIKKIKKRFGKKSITTGDKIKRPGNRQLFDDFKKRNKFNVGGMANLSQTYDNNPTLQAQFPNKQDYLDLFGGIASTTVAQTTTPTMAQQATQSTAIKPIKPIIPIPESGDGGGGITPKGFDKGYSSANFGLGPNKDVVDYEAEAYGVGRTPLGTLSGIITSIPSLSKTAFQFVKKAGESLADRFRKSADAKRLADRIAAEQERARIADELARQMNQVYYDNPGADFTGGRYDGASSRSEYESNPTGFSGSS